MTNIFYQVQKWTISAMALVKVQIERVKSSQKAVTVLRILLAVLALTLWTLITFRVAHHQAEESYEAWKIRYVDDYIAQQEAKALGYPADPREELRKQEVTALARLISGLKLYGYGMDDYRTLAQGLMCRKANDGYPDTLVEVIEQPQQWPGYSETNEITKREKDIAEQILKEFDAQELPEVSSDYVYASFERDGITLRDTWEISTRTHFWRAGE